MSNPQHLIPHALHDENSKVAAVVLIIVGIFFTPFLFGIPLLAIGIYRLFK